MSETFGKKAWETKKAFIERDKTSIKIKKIEEEIANHNKEKKEVAETYSNLSDFNSENPDMFKMQAQKSIDEINNNIKEKEIRLEELKELQKKEINNLIKNN